MKSDLNEIVVRIKNKDELAVGQLYEAIKPQSLSIANRYVNSAYAEDMFHNAFIKALANMDSFDINRSFMSWFDVILVNTCKDFLAKKDNSATRNFSEMDANSAVSDEDNNYINSLESTDKDYNPEASLDAKALSQIMGDIISSLSDEQREALILFYYNEMSVKDIANKKGVSENTIKSRLNYARNKVGQEVEAYEKKNGIKLRSIGAIPLLLLFLHSGEGAKLASTISAAAVGTSAGLKAGFAKFISTVYGKIITALAGLGLVGATVATVILLLPSDPLTYQVMAGMKHEAGQLSLDTLNSYGSHNYIEKDEKGQLIILEKPNPFNNYLSEEEDPDNTQMCTDILLDHRGEIYDFYKDVNELAAAYAKDNPGCTLNNLRNVTDERSLDVTEYFPEEITIPTSEYGKVKIKVSKVKLIVRYSTVLDDENLTDTRDGSVFRMSSDGKNTPIIFFDTLVNGQMKRTFPETYYINFYGKIQSL